MNAARPKRRPRRESEENFPRRGSFRGWLAFASAAAAGALVWAVSPRFTGAREPWDADGPYYVSALAVAGFCVGLFTSGRAWRGEGGSPKQASDDVRRLAAIYAGLIIGQLAYMLLFLPASPLIVLGAVFLAAFSVVGLVAAAAGRGVRGFIGKGG